VRDVGFFFTWLVLLPLSLYSAHIGVLLWIWVALLSPNELLYGFMISVPYNKIVAASTILLLAVGKEKNKFYVDRVVVLAALFGLVVTLAWLFKDFDHPAADATYDKFWKQLVLGLLITGVMWSRHRLHQVVLVVAISYGFLMAKEALIYLLTAGGHQILGTGSTGDNNVLAMAILMTIPLMLFVANNLAERWVRLAITATAVLGVVTVIASYSRGGLVGLIALGMMLLKGSKYKVRSFVAVAVVGAVIYGFAPDSWFARMNTISEAGEDSSFVTRLVAWKINFLLALDHPFLGGGPMASLLWVNWAKYLEASSTFLFSTPLIYRTFVAHSIYFQVLGDTGFLGLAMFLLLLVTAFMMARRTKLMVRAHPELAWAGELARALQISLVVYAVAGGALSLVYFELLFIVLGLVSRTHMTVAEAIAAKAVPVRAALPSRLVPAYRTA